MALYTLTDTSHPWTCVCVRGHYDSLQGHAFVLVVPSHTFRDFISETMSSSTSGAIDAFSSTSGAIDAFSSTKKPHHTKKRTFPTFQEIVGEESMSEAYRCLNPNCKSTNTVIQSRQTRAADEPTTQYLKCWECGLMKRICG